MAEVGLVLQVHGEVTDPAVDVFDREARFIERVLAPLSERHPQLRIVFEHITTRAAVQFVLGAREGIAATVTPQHLLMNRNALFTGGLRPHHYCLPVLKEETHRAALLAAVATGTPRIFLGTDSAPHARAAKESACGCAGIFSAHAALGRRVGKARGVRRLSRRGLLPSAAQSRATHPGQASLAGARALSLRRRRTRAAARGRAGALAPGSLKARV
jgi:dihydroorotase (homodimeric type)